jgi:transposase
MSGCTRAVPIRLTVKRRRKLEQIVAAGTSPQRLVLRARIVLAAAGGAADAAIARDLGCSVATVRTWRRRFACRGIPGLFDRPRSGRPETHGPSARLAVVAVAASVPPDGESQWSHLLIAGHLRVRGLAISAATVGRVLAEAKVRPHKVRGWLSRADDPCFWLRAGQVCRLYLNPPPGTVLISVDEKTGIQAKSRKHPQIPARAGRDARREFEYVRHGTVSIIAGMNVATGEVIAERIEKNDSAAFTAFLAMLHRMIPPCLRIHLICGNGSSHTSAAARLARRASRVRGDLHARARFLAQHDRTMVRCPGQAAAAPRRLRLPRRAGSRDRRVHHPVQQERLPVQVELPRRHRPRPLPPAPPPARVRPRGSRLTATLRNQEPVRSLRCAA